VQQEKSTCIITVTRRWGRWLGDEHRIVTKRGKRQMMTGKTPGTQVGSRRQWKGRREGRWGGERGVHVLAFFVVYRVATIRRCSTWLGSL